MSHKHLQQCENGLDLADYAINKGAVELRHNGHIILRLPDGTTEAIPAHRKQLGKGLRAKIVKHLIAAGIALLLLIPIIQHMT